MSKAPWRPQARAPISSSRSEMVRYGVDSYSSTEESGDDEVDNIQSKPLRDPNCSVSPSQTKWQRDTSSLANYECYSTDTSELTLNESVNESFHRSQSLERLSQHNHTNKGKDSSATILCLSLITIIVGVLAAIYITMFPTLPYENSDLAVTEHTLFSDNLLSIKKKYEISDDSILQVESGVRTIFDKNITGSFTFVYNSESKNFNLNNFENFVNEAALVTARYLRNTDSSNGKNTGAIRHTVLTGSDIALKNHGEFMNKYRKNVEQTGVMLVKDLEMVPSDVAMAFHYYCDEYNPLVKKSAIFFTMDLGKCSSDYGKKMHAFIENCLKQKWSSVSPEKITPLLTRVVTEVIDIYSIFQ